MSDRNHDTSFRLVDSKTLMLGVPAASFAATLQLLQSPPPSIAHPHAVALAAFTASLVLPVAMIFSVEELRRARAAGWTGETLLTKFVLSTLMVLAFMGFAIGLAAMYWHVSPWAATGAALLAIGGVSCSSLIEGQLAAKAAEAHAVRKDRWRRVKVHYPLRARRR